MSFWPCLSLLINMELPTKVGKNPEYCILSSVIVFISSWCCSFKFMVKFRKIKFTCEHFFFIQLLLPLEKCQLFLTLTALRLCCWHYVEPQQLKQEYISSLMYSNYWCPSDVGNQKFEQRILLIVARILRSLASFAFLTRSGSLWLQWLV